MDVKIHKTLQWLAANRNRKIGAYLYATGEGQPFLFEDPIGFSQPTPLDPVMFDKLLSNKWIELFFEYPEYKSWKISRLGRNAIKKESK